MDRQRPDGAARPERADAFALVGEVPKFDRAIVAVRKKGGVSKRGEREK